jgi:two-component system sensor histidine kinase KdpD
VRPFRWGAGLAWLGALGALAAAMVPLRASLDKTHITLAFLLLVLLASATAGKRIGLAVALGAFLLFNFLFLPPFYRLTLENPLDWLVLAAFLVTAFVAAQLLDQAQRKADEARDRGDEVARLAALGAEALNAPRADLALTGVADVIRETLPVERCVVHATQAERAGDDLVAAVLQRGVAFSELPDGTSRAMRAQTGQTGEWWIGAPGRVTRLLLPLRVRGTTVGALELAEARGFELNPSQQRMLDAMTFYAALGVERSRMEAEVRHIAALEEADRLKDILIASVSHDLRTPLTTIKALAHGMQSHADERAEIIEQEADRLNRLVSDLLDLSRLSTGSLKLTIEAIPVDDLISAAVQRVEGALGERRLDVSLGDAGSLLVGRFDLAHSVRILVNLIENAVKYAPTDTPIEVDVTRRDQWIEVTVSDRGPGVAPDEAERIFQPLYRPANAPPDRGSAGLGLALARQFAEAQGGALAYAPRAGGGSVFTLRLPAVDLVQPNGHEKH